MNRSALTPALALLLPLFVAACGETGGDTDSGADTTGAPAQAVPDTQAMAADTQTMELSDIGLSTPESVLYDEQADVYLVSNIGGSPLEKDGNGFIARVAPDGTVDSLRWIDGGTEGVTLNAPKGMAFHGDTLFVADIDSVRAFHRGTGEALGARGVPDATFLNDLAVGPDGTLYVSDSGLEPDFSSSGTDAVYRFEGQRAVAVLEGTELSSPNGLVVVDSMLYMVPFGSPTIRGLRLGQQEAEQLTVLPAGQLDGVVALEDGSLLVSSWEGQAVYRARVDDPNAQVETVVEGIPSPADIGYDTRRDRILIPVFNEDRLVIRPLR